MKKLKTLLQYDKSEGLLLYCLIAYILTLISLIKPVIIIFLLIYLIYLFKQSKVLFIYSIIGSILLALSFFIYILIEHNIDIPNSITGIVTKIDDNYLLVKYRSHIIKVYSNSISNISYGDKIQLIGVESNAITKSIEENFNYFRYKLSKNIFYEMKSDNITIISSHFNIHKLKGYIIKYIDNSFSEVSSVYIKRLILGISNFDSELNDSINNMGIVYLFAISGLHITILSSFIKKILRLFNIYEEIISIILIGLLILYLLITESSSSIRRAIFMTSILEISSIVNYKVSKLDLLSISFLVSFIINPFSFFNIGSILTYSSTAIIILLRDKNSLTISLGVITFSIPLLLYYNHKISLFIILFSIAFSPLFTKLIIPLSYITFFLWPLDYLYSKIVIILNEIFYMIEDVNIMINFSIRNPIYLLLIYLCIILLFTKLDSIKHIIKYSFLVIIFLVSNYTFGRISIIPSVKFFDVGQGDSALIRYGKYNILVDTGYYDKYNSVIKYLNSQNIYRLDAVFITHDDSDHSGNVENIMSNIKVNKIYNNVRNNTYNYSNLIIETYKNENGNSVNDRSTVLLVRINDKKVLITGDIEFESEKELVNKNIGNIDILKVAHHGAKTSSSNIFLNHTIPKLSIISVGLNNKYNHPTKDALDRLKNVNSKVLRTDQEGTITTFLFKRIIIVKRYKNNRYNRYSFIT